MNREMIRRWNSRVVEGDTVFHLGDLCFEGGGQKPFEHWISVLNGNLILIRGNHDRRKRSVIRSIDIRLAGYDVHLSHEPELVYKINLSGHVHSNWKVQLHGPRAIVNVGVEQWNYFPVSFPEILQAIGKARTKSR